MEAGGKQEGRGGLTGLQEKGWGGGAKAHKKQLLDLAFKQAMA